MSTQNPNTKGCLVTILAVIGSLWILIFSAVDLFSGWLVEQTMVEASFALPDTRWISHLLFSGLILTVSGLMALFVKEARIKKMFSLWNLAALLSVIATPIRLFYLSAQNATTVLQIWMMLLILTGFTFIYKKKNGEVADQSDSKGRVSGFVVLLVCTLCLPWVLWGALGSILDTILAVLLGFTLAWFAVKLVFTLYLEDPNRSQSKGNASAIIFDGFVAAVFLLVVVSALAVNGSQQMLVFTVPITGWLVAFFFHLWRDNVKRAKFSAGLFIGLAAALPLAFFDMDELSSMITGSSGETLQWATRAAATTLVSIFFLTILAVLSYKLLKKIVLPGYAGFLFTAIGLLGIVTAYWGWGQVGFFGDKQFVILKEQADLTSQAKIGNYSERRQTVYLDLVSIADTSQAGLRARLDKWHIGYTPYYLLNSMEVNGGSLVKLLLEKDPAVDRILDSPHLRPLPEKPGLESAELTTLPDGALWNIDMVEADRVVKELGVNGSGIIIGQTDSGVDGKQPELAAAYRGAESGDDYNWLDPWNGSPFPTDAGGHGTMTLSVALGKDVGVAPGAQWIGCVNLARNLGNAALYLNCMQFMLAPFPQGGDPFMDGDPSKGAMIVNNSWGCPEIEGCDAGVFQSAVDAMKDAGIFMSVAAGNSGNYGCSTVSDPPSIYADVLTAGSINEFGDLSYFSSIGPVAVDGSERRKPDLLAPGENVLAAFPGGGYSYVSGTSFSAPHVTGVVALMWSANPELIGDVDATTEILKSSTKVYNGNDPTCGTTADATGSGILDAYQAVEAALDY